MGRLNMNHAILVGAYRLFYFIFILFVFFLYHVGLRWTVHASNVYQSDDDTPLILADVGLQETRI